MLPLIFADASKLSRNSECGDILSATSRSSWSPRGSITNSISIDGHEAHDSTYLPPISNCPSLTSERTDGSIASQDSMESPYSLSRCMDGNLAAIEESFFCADPTSQKQPCPGLQVDVEQHYGAALLNSSRPPQIASTSLRLSAMLSPLMISPYQQSHSSYSRNSSMSPSSVPLRNLRCLESTFPDMRPHSPGEADEVSSLNLRKKALTPTNLLRAAATPTHNRISPRPRPTSLPIMSSSRNLLISPSSVHSASPRCSIFSVNSIHSSNLCNFQGGRPVSWCATARSDDSAMTGAEVEETVKHAIAVALEEEAIEEEEVDVEEQSSPELFRAAIIEKDFVKPPRISPFSPKSDFI